MRKNSQIYLTVFIGRMKQPHYSTKPHQLGSDFDNLPYWITSANPSPSQLQPIGDLVIIPVEPATKPLVANSTAGRHRNRCQGCKEIYVWDRSLDHLLHGVAARRAKLLLPLHQDCIEQRSGRIVLAHGLDAVAGVLAVEP